MKHNLSLPLRIGDLFRTVWKHRVLILLLTLTGLVAGIALSLFTDSRGGISKEYAITTSIAVTSVTEDGLFTTRSSIPSSVDVYLAENMVDSVIYVLRSDKLLENALNSAGIRDVSTSALAENLVLKQYNLTQIVEMTLLWRNAEEGVQILSAINAAAPDVLIEALKIGGVTVVNEPVAKHRSSGNAATCVYTALLGFLIGVGISILALWLNPTLMRAEDMECIFGVDVLGEVPANKKIFRRRRALPVELGDTPGQNVAESFASAAHILQNKLEDIPHKILYITSSAQQEGKTSAAANLAMHLANLEQRVLLIDFNVHNPELGSWFMNAVEYPRSLNALYCGEATLDKAITNVAEYLDLLPAIREEKELPLDDAMMELVKSLSENYDYVLMDTASVGRFADPMNLNRISHGVLFVARYDSTRIRDIHEALSRLDKSGVRTVGCIVNGVHATSQR